MLLSLTEKQETVPAEKKDENGNRVIVKSNNKQKCYYRRQINSTLKLDKLFILDVSSSIVGSAMFLSPDFRPSTTIISLS